MSSNKKHNNEVIKVTIVVREYVGWNQWTTALYKKHQYDMKCNTETNVTAKAKLSKTKHIWKLNKTTTFGTIRIQIGEYYNINPFNIEIWVGVNHKKKGTVKWDYGAAGRGFWDEMIDDYCRFRCSSNCKYLFMKFEIVAYDVKIFDKMILEQEHINLWSKCRKREILKLVINKKVSELAIFNFDIYSPTQNGLEIDNNKALIMTIIHNKNWKAKQIISQILSYAISNIIYGYVYFSSILKYIQWCDINTINVSMLKTLEINQFIICEDNTKKIPPTWRMNQLYQFPSHFSSIKYTDFRIQFLSINDPFIKKSLCKSLWVRFETKKTKNSKYCRILVNKHDTFKYIVMNQICKHLNAIISSKETNYKPPSYHEYITSHGFVLYKYSKSNSVIHLKANLSIYDVINITSRLIITISSECDERENNQSNNNQSCIVSYINGHNIIKDNNMTNELYINILDMGMKQLLQTDIVYKNTTFKELYYDWSQQTNIPINCLMVYNYTERKNKTFRPNRNITLKLEECKYDIDIQNGMYKTKIKRPKNIHERIGNIVTYRRQYLLLDTRKCNILATYSMNVQFRLIALKYFDFLQQKLYFVDWILIQTDPQQFTIKDLSKYIENKLIPVTASKRSYFKHLNHCINQLNEFDINSEYNKFMFYEEEAVIKNENSRKNICKIPYLSYDTYIGSFDYFDGDIFIFQLNPYHSYFLLKQPLYLKHTYPVVDSFIEAKLKSTDSSIYYNLGTENHKFIPFCSSSKSKLNTKIFYYQNICIGQTKNDIIVFEHQSFEELRFEDQYNSFITKVNNNNISNEIHSLKYDIQYKHFQRMKNELTHKYKYLQTYNDAFYTQLSSLNISELNLVKLEQIGNLFQSLKFSEEKISKYCHGLTIQQFINWMSSINRQINMTKRFNCIFANILMTGITLYFVNNYVKFPYSHIQFIGHKTGNAILQLRKILCKPTFSTDIDDIIRVRYAYYVSVITAIHSNDFVIIKNIYYFQLWLIKYKFQIQEQISVQTFTIIQKLTAISNLVNNILKSSNIYKFNNGNNIIVKYCVRKLWRCFYYVININWNDCKYEHYVTILGLMLQIINAIKVCYQILNMNLSDCQVKLYKKIYQIDDEIVQSELSIVVNDLKIHKINITNRDKLGLKYEQHELFETKYKMIWIKQMVQGIKCEWCNKQHKQLKCCRKCQLKWYCCKKHQKLDWNKQHRKYCK